MNIDGRETVKDFGYDVQLINPGTLVYLGGSHNTSSHIHSHHFRGIIQKVSKPYFMSFIRYYYYYYYYYYY